MFEIMKSCGQAFLQHWWVDLFSMVYKIFDVSKFTDVQFDVSWWGVLSVSLDYVIYSKLRTALILAEIEVQFSDAFTSTSIL